jgi:hypothetical protein
MPAGRIRAVIDDLPDRGGQVVTLRDIEGPHQRGGTRHAGDQPRQPASAAAPGRSRLRQDIRTRSGRSVMMLPKPRLRRNIVCQRAVEVVTGYLEGTLARAGRRRFEEHLADCPHCTEYLAQMRKTIELTGSLAPDHLTPQMRDQFIAIYRHRRARRDG